MNWKIETKQITAIESDREKVTAFVHYRQEVGEGTVDRTDKIEIPLDAVTVKEFPSLVTGATVYYYLYPELAIRRPVRVGEVLFPPEPLPDQVHQLAIRRPVRVGEVWLRNYLEEIPVLKRWMVSRKVSQMAKKQNR